MPWSSVAAIVRRTGSPGTIVVSTAGACRSTRGAESGTTSIWSAAGRSRRAAARDAAWKRQLPDVSTGSTPENW
jgi:hypothetical protein